MKSLATMESLLLFITALLKKWWILMSCAAFTILGLWAFVFQKNHAWVMKVSFSAALLFFLWAAFQAWNDEHQARVEAGSNVVGPKIDLNWKAYGSVDKVLVVENSGSVDVYDLQVQEISLTPELTGTFDQITRLKANQQITMLPYITGAGISQVPHKDRDFEMILYASGELPQECTARLNNGDVMQIRCPLVIKFKDYGGNQYESSFEFVTDTLFHKDEIRFIKRIRKG